MAKQKRRPGGRRLSRYPAREGGIAGLQALGDGEDEVVVVAIDIVAGVGQAQVQASQGLADAQAPVDVVVAGFFVVVELGLADRGGQAGSSRS